MKESPLNNFMFFKDSSIVIWNGLVPEKTYFWFYRSWDFLQMTLFKVHQDEDYFLVKWLKYMIAYK